MAGLDVAISVDSKGAWRDNVFIERLWRSFKYEEVFLRAFASVSEARASIAATPKLRFGLDGTSPIKPTSTLHSAWTLPQRGSTCRHGESLQANGTNSF